MRKFDEYAFFPMDVLRVTQGPGYAVDGVPACTYSHGGQHAYDIAGKDGSKSPVYAPFSCTVKRIYNGKTTASKCNFTWYINTKRVKTLDGSIYDPGNLIFMTAHCDTANLNKYGIRVGASFAQGEICGYEGNAGNVAAHCHLMVGRGPWTGTGWFNNNGGWEINNPLFVHQVMWLRPTCQILGTGGYPWTVLQDTTIPEYPDEPVPSPEPAQPEQPTQPAEPTQPVEPEPPAGNYFPRYTGNTISIVTALASLGINSSFNYRAKIAAANNIAGYAGTPAQNTLMLNLLKQGVLVNPDSSYLAVQYYPKCNYTGVSIVVALNSIGVDSSYSHRVKIAKANHIANYTGAPAQNTQMLNLLKQGKLVKE